MIPLLTHTLSGATIGGLAILLAVLIFCAVIPFPRGQQ